MDESAFWIGFSAAPNIGPKRFSNLLKRFGSAKAAWEASELALAEVIGKVYAEKLQLFRKKFSLDLYGEALRKRSISFVTLADANYPSLLKNIPNPPFVLYVKGDREILKPIRQAQGPAYIEGQVQNDPMTSRRCSEEDSGQAGFIGVVGTRRVTSYGKIVTEMITSELVDSGFTIVSGLALGVDAVAHKTTVAKGGKTIAVLGCGVDCCSPKENFVLYNSIVQNHGAVVSEYPLGMLPTVGSFPSRNRIIAGISQAVVVTEGAADSGSLITASKALEFGRPVFAVPGPITSSLSHGPNKLLAEGAKLVTSGEDILKEMGIKGTKSIKSIKSIKSRIKGDTKEEQQIINLLQSESLHFDEIVKKTGYDSSMTGILLSLLEMKGVIENGREGYLIKSP